ncbi:MAG: hypothetical protein A2W80_11080 [Candidatus Riflebacteria bacterium GWC2_50_8]|nr:MAG: hypothetical protein A2W80_11080 [Candidatus Riflebacteria bacterium GWC2_50_8]
MIQPKDIERLTIFRGDIAAGTLERTSSGCCFNFNPDFLTDQRYQWLALRIKKSRHPISISGSNLHPFFAGLLPEGLRLNSLIRNLKTSPDDLFSLFAAAGGNVIGDVFARTTDNGAPPGVELPPKLKQIDFYEHLQQLLAINSYQLGEDSIAGVQEKISASMISFPVNIARQTCSYILKLNPADKPGLVENELHCMDLAAKCGLLTAKVKLVRDGSDNCGLLVQRFDREYNAQQNKMLMHHQEDACQFLDRYPADKYRLSLNDIARGITELSSAAEVMLAKLLQLYCFSYLLGNGDLHGKNISLLVRSGSSLVEMTPAYDLICTLIYGDHKMAIKIDGRDDNIKRRNILEFARRFNLPQPAVESMLDKLLHRFTRHSRILEKIPMTDRQKALLFRTIQKRIIDLQ